MLYVPMFKNRPEEMRVVKELNQCFGKDIVPLIEVIDEYYETRYKVDQITGKFIKVQVGKQKRRIQIDPTEEDINTLQVINKLTDNKEMFIDYFRYTTKKYGTSIDIEKVGLSRKLNDSFALYKTKILGLIEYKNIIPVISIKDGYPIQKVELIKLMREVKEGTSRVAIRLTDNFIEPLSEVLQEELDKNDFVMLDIEEQLPKSKFIEYEEMEELGLLAQIILLNSPRHVKRKNGDYPENAYTALIDNSAKDYVEEYNFSGYGDYCGLKDVLPRTGGSKGLGAALALIYDFEENAFWAYTNKNIEDGMSGYNKLIPIILEDRERFDPHGTCSGFDKIASLDGSGNWSTWHNICARRYLWQVSETLT
jgi:hypothetical protein